MINRDKLEQEERRRIKDEVAPVVLRDLEEGKFDLMKVYPEFELKEPYGLGPLLNSLHVLAPFYNQVIVAIDPIEEERDFERYYGLKIQALVKLYREGKIIPLISDPYQKYASYFDALFKEGFIPRYGRVATVFDMFRSKEEEKSILKEAKKEALNKVKNAGYGEEIMEYHEIFSKPRELITETVATWLSYLKIFGYERIYMEICDMDDPNMVYKLSGGYNRFLITPCIVGLGGYSNYDEKSIQQLKTLKDLSIEDILDNKTIALSQNLLYKFIAESLKYEHPLKVKDPVKFWEKIDDRDEKREALGILSELQKYCEELKFKKAYEIREKKEVSDVISNLNDEAKKIAGIEGKIKSYLDPCFIATTPEALQAISPIVGVVVISSLLGFMELYKRHTEKYDKIISRCAEFITECRYKDVPKLMGRNIAPGILWKFQYKTNI